VLTPVLFLARIGTVPGDLAPRAHFEVLQIAHNLAPVVDAIPTPLHRENAKRFEKRFEKVERIALPCYAPLLQPIYHALEDLRGDVVTLHVPSRHGDTSGLHLHMPNLAGVGNVCVHIAGESQAQIDDALNYFNIPYHPIAADFRDGRVATLANINFEAKYKNERYKILVYRETRRGGTWRRAWRRAWWWPMRERRVLKRDKRSTSIK
jgi:hypothetical protein